MWPLARCGPSEDPRSHFLIANPQKLAPTSQTSLVRTPRPQQPSAFPDLPCPRHPSLRSLVTVSFSDLLAGRIRHLWFSFDPSSLTECPGSRERRARAAAPAHPPRRSPGQCARRLPPGPALHAAPAPRSLPAAAPPAVTQLRPLASLSKHRHSTPAPVRAPRPAHSHFRPEMRRP